jgi:PAS domain S-box-containing protein
LFSRHKRLAMLGIASLVLIAFAGLFYRQWKDYRRAKSELERSRQISDAIDSVLTTLLDAETGQRGYLLTGDNRYLDPYDRALQRFPDDLANLKKLLTASRGEAQEFEELNALANRKVDELRRTIEIRRAQGTQAALAVVLTNEGKRTMDSIRALCAQMKSDERANEAGATRNGVDASEAVLLIMVAGSLVLLFLFAFGFEPFASPEPEAWRRSWLLRYGAAILAVVAITLIRAALTPLIGPTNFPFTLYFCAVMFAAWFGGFRPAVVSIALSLLAGDWFFAAPHGTLRVSGRDDQIAMLMVVLVGFGTGLLSRSQRSAVDRALRAEEAERAERRRFETTLSSIGDAVIATDAEGRVTFLNSVASALLKWPEAEARGELLEDVFRIVNEVTRTAVQSPVTQVLRDGQIVGLANHTILIGRDGSDVPIDDSAAPIRDSDGKIRGTVLVFRDVTERRLTEKQLAEQALLLERAASEAREQRERLGLALTSGKMGVFEVNPAENAFWWSSESYSLFGVSPAEFVPNRDSFAALIHPRDRETFMQYWDENTAERQPINHEFRVLMPGSKERWISCRGFPKHNESGSLMRYTGLFVDITERKGTEQVLRQFEKLSAAARLSAAIAHEINNPLSAVTNLVFLAKEAPGVPESIVEQLALAEQELERVAHAARQALGFYRESSREELIDVPELVDSVVKIFSTKLGEKQVNVVRGLANCPPIYAVRGEIRQVLSNLLSNAIEAVNEGGTITVGTRSVVSADENLVEMIVADDGHGIAPEQLPHIFEPFFTTKAATGTGLGLWVAKEIAERHQGSIEVQSSEGHQRGTTFTVRLPSRSGKRQSRTSMDPTQSATNLQQDFSESRGSAKLG